MRLRACQYEWTFPRPALVMGIVNVTPDSFSDGGRYYSVAAAVEHAHALVAEGAEIIDVGGESSRPYATPVSEAEELRRVLPVMERLAGELRVPISVDTRKPEVARRALAAGASLINDIAANQADEAMGRLVAETGAGYVVMHMQGTPQDMQRQPSYVAVGREVRAFMEEQMARLTSLGVRPEQLILDVGIGFGKTARHNLELLAGLNHFTNLHRPLLVGVSRKSFIGQLLGLDVDARLPGALACGCWAVQAGANLIRTHDVAATVAALRMTEAILTTARL